MSRSDELDLLSSDTQSILGDATITVHQNRPTGAIDPGTRDRNIDVSAVNASVLAVEGEKRMVRYGESRVVQRDWIVRASAVGFRPSTKGTVTDAAGLVWDIAEVHEMSNAREYRIVGEKRG